MRHVADVRSRERADGQRRLVLACSCGWEHELDPDDVPGDVHAHHVDEEQKENAA